MAGRKWKVGRTLRPGAYDHLQADYETTWIDHPGPIGGSASHEGKVEVHGDVGTTAALAREIVKLLNAQ